MSYKVKKARKFEAATSNKYACMGVGGGGGGGSGIHYSLKI